MSLNRVPYFILASTLLLALCKAFQVYYVPTGKFTLCEDSAPGSGLGDRLLALFEACAVARIAEAAVLKVAWRHSWSPARGFSFMELQPPAPAHFVYYVPRFGGIGRCDASLQSVSEAAHKKNTKNDYVRACARDTHSAPFIADMICREMLSNATGVHIRRGDKMLAKVQLEVGARHSLMHEQTDEEWRLIALRSLQYCSQLISQGHRRFFVSGDEPLVLAGYAHKLEALGGEVILDEELNACLSRTQRAYYSALGSMRGTNVLDLMRFASCDRVLQISKYSSFSTAAALLGDLPLVNFYGPNGSAIDGVKEVARVEFFTPPVSAALLKASVVGEPLNAKDSIGCTADNLFCRHTPEVDAGDGPLRSSRGRTSRS